MHALLYDYWPALANMSAKDFWHGHLLRFSALRTDRLPPHLQAQMLLLHWSAGRGAFELQAVGSALQAVVDRLDAAVASASRPGSGAGGSVFSREFLQSLAATADSNELLLKSNTRPFHNRNTTGDFLMIPVSKTGAAVDYVMCLFSRLRFDTAETGWRQPTVAPSAGSRRRDH